MKTKYLLYVLVAGMIGWMGCSDDDETLTPSDIDEYELTIPQGNHEYDARIVDFYDHTGVYMLYKYSDREIFFSVDNAWPFIYADTNLTVTKFDMEEYMMTVSDGILYMFGQEMGPLDVENYYDEGCYSRYTVDGNTLYWEEQWLTWKGTFQVDEADENYVGKQIDWIEEIFLDFYSDSILRVAMPLKILLGKNLKENSASQRVSCPYYAYFNNLILNYGDESVETLTASEKKTIKLDLHYWFLTERLSSMVSFDEFYSVTDYYWAGGSSSSVPSSGQWYALGVLNVMNWSTILISIHENDLKTYLNMITGNSYTTLTKEPADGNYDASDYTGILHPKKDVNGLIRMKYDILINEFKKNGVDLQAIGNCTIGD